MKSLKVKKRNSKMFSKNTFSKMLIDFDLFSFRPLYIFWEIFAAQFLEK